jgi:hypothetical protein
VSTLQAADSERRGPALLRRGTKQSEWLLAIMLVSCALFSALAFWESTRYGSLSSDHTNQARFTESGDSKWFSSVQTKIAHDRRAGLGCEAAIRHRDVLLEEYARTFSEATRAQIVEAEQTRVALASQMIGSGAICPGYEVSSTMDQEAFNRQDQAGAGTAQLLYERAEVFDKAENIAVGATVFFALALLGLTVADGVKVEPRYRFLLVGSMVLVIAGLGILGWASLVSGRWSLALIVIVVVLSGAFAALAWVLTRPEASPWRQRLGWNRSVSWWTDLLGAFTLVFLTLGVLGGSMASISDRQISAQANLLESDSKRALEIGQQSALAVLGIIQEAARMEAVIAAGVDGPGQVAGEVSAATLRDVVLKEMWPLEQQLWEAVLAEHHTARQGAGDAASSTSSLGCLDEAMLLPWRSEMFAMLDTNGQGLPESLMASYRDDYNTYWSLIVQAGTGASVCSAQAAVLVDAASERAEQASAYTIAVVILGVAGFLFAFAADDDRSRDTSHWMLAAAAIGLFAGSAVLVNAWRSAPELPAEDTIAQGTLAYARAETAQAVVHCDEARRNASEAVALLPDFAPAHVTYAHSFVCDEGTDFIDADESDENLQGFLDSLQTAVDDLGSESSVAKAGLGWALILEHLRGGDEASDDDLTRAENLTLEALEADPSNPFACFNWAFTSLIRGDLEEATSRYRHAVDRLEGKEDGDGPCHPVEFEDPAIRTVMKALALSDLELLADTEASDRIRALIVGGGEGGAGVAVSTEGFTIDVYQNSISLTSATDGPEIAPLSIVWYYRVGPADVWAVMRYPTLLSLEPGEGYLGHWERLGLLPDGEYRVDVYSSGVVTHRITATSDLWDSYTLEPSAFKPIYMGDLGVSAAVPAEWALLSDIPGTEVVYAGDDGRVAFRRVEASAYEDLQPTLDAWTTATLEQWGQPALSPDETGLNEGSWYLGLAQTLTAEARSGLLRGAGHSQYVVAGESGLLSDDFIRMPTCPGTSLMSLIQAGDPDVAETIWLSMSSDPPFTVDLQEVGLTGTFTTSDFTVALPEGWHATGCPRNFAAIEEEARASLLVSADPTNETLDSYVQLSIDEMVATFPQFELVSREPFRLTNGVDGERIHYTWVEDGVAFDQTQLYAPAGGRVYFLTFTRTLADASDFTDELELILGSFQVGEAPEPLVSAVCADCTADQIRERQLHLDEIADFIFVVGEECRDATDEVGTPALARIACTFPGGFEVTYSRWPEPAAMESILEQVRGVEGATVQEWDTFGDFDNPDGTTVEWVEAGAARFFWTYDERLISGDAALDGGDQQRLNNWWQTAGALTRD